VFGVPIQGDAVEVDKSRIKIVDAGKRSIIIEPLNEPRPGEHWTLRVPLADGKAPTLAEFALVAHPSEVDTEIDVSRPKEKEAACQTACAPCAALSPADAVTSGLFDDAGVQPGRVDAVEHSSGGFKSYPGMIYRAMRWVLVDVQIIPPPEYPTWRPTGATLTSKGGEARVRAVKVQPGDFPGTVRVLVETDVPPPSAGLQFALNLHGPEGAPFFSIPKVDLPPAKERKP
jgi:uncharacterized protein (TIGR02268 family)